MVFSYYHRLDARRRRLYELSDAIVEIPLAETKALRTLTRSLEEALTRGERRLVNRAAQSLVDGLCQELRVPSVPVAVLERRPARAGSELHGLYEYAPPGQPVSRRILVWMHTAKQGRVVAFRTFLRTLIHEVCHHLDVTLLRFPESLHTEGFYARESKLVRVLLGEETANPGDRGCAPTLRAGTARPDLHSSSRPESRDRDNEDDRNGRRGRQEPG